MTFGTNFWYHFWGHYTPVISKERNLKGADAPLGGPTHGATLLPPPSCDDWKN